MKKVVALLLALVALGASAAFAMKVPQAHVLFTVGTDVKSADVELLEEWEIAAIELEKWLANPASRDMLAERAKSLNFSNVSPDSTLTVTLSEDPSIEPMICAVVASSDKLGKGKIADELNATVTLSEDMTVYVAVKTWRMPFAAVVKANVTMSKKKPEYKGTGAPKIAQVIKTDSSALGVRKALDLYGGEIPKPVTQETANKVGETVASKANQALSSYNITVKSADTYVLPMINASADKLYGVTLSVDLSTGKGVAFVGLDSADVKTKAIVVIEDYDDYDEEDFDVDLAAAEASFYTPDGKTAVADALNPYFANSEYAAVAGIMNKTVKSVYVEAMFAKAGEVYPVLATFDVPTVPSGTSPKSGTSPVVPGGSASSHSGCDMGLVSGLAVLLAALLPLRKVRK